MLSRPAFHAYIQKSQSLDVLIDVLIKYFNGISYDKRAAEGYYTFVSQMLARGLYVVATPLFGQVGNSGAGRLDHDKFWASATSSKEAITLFDNNFLCEVFEKINKDEFISQFFNGSHGILTDFNELLREASPKVPFINEIYGRLFECGLDRLTGSELDGCSFFTLQSYNAMYLFWCSIDSEKASDWLSRFTPQIPALMDKFSRIYASCLNGFFNAFNVPFRLTFTEAERSQIKICIKQYLPDRPAGSHPNEALLPALLSTGILTSKSSLTKVLRRRR